MTTRCLLKKSHFQLNGGDKKVAVKNRNIVKYRTQLRNMSLKHYKGAPQSPL